MKRPFHSFEALHHRSWQRRLFCLLCLVFCLLLTSFAIITSTRLHPSAFAEQPQSQDESKAIQRIELNRSIERTLTPPQGHSYELALIKGQFLQITAAGDQLWLSIGVLLREVKPTAGDSGFKAPSSLSVSLIAPETATYQIIISANGKMPSGKYHLLVTLPQNPPPDFFARARAQQLLGELSKLYYEQRDREAFLKMPEVGEEAARLFAQLGMLQKQAEALNLVAEAWRQLGKHAQAIETFERSVQISRAIGYHLKTAEVLTFIGMCRYQLSDYRRAIESYYEALPVWDAARAESLPLFNMSGWTLTQLGYAQQALGEMRQALASFEESAGFYHRYHEAGSSEQEWHFGTAFALRGIGRIHALAGEKQKAIDALSKALEHFKGANDDYYAPLLLNEMGELYASLGERDQAFELYERALKLEQRMGSRATEAQTLYLIGRLHQATGALAEAEQQFNQSLEIRRSVGDRRGQAAALNSLGEIYAVRGEQQRALVAFEEALAIQQEIGDRYSEGTALNNLGTVYAALGDEAQALERFKQSLALRRSLGDREGEANTRYHLARLARDTGNFAEARTQIEAAIKLTEFVRSSVLSQELRTTYQGTVQDYYEFYLDLLMQQHRQSGSMELVATALQVSEMMRARSLLETLAEARADIRAGVPQDLLVQERELQERLRAKSEYQLRLHTGRPTPEQVTAAAREIQTVTAEYQAVRARIRATSPRYAALTQPQPLTVAEIQHQVLDGETLLLEYALAEPRSYLWIVSRGEIHNYELPGRAAIETAARQVYALLTARNQFGSRESSTQRRARIAQADAALPRATAALSHMILAPAAAQLGSKRLLVVAQGALQLIPFAALPEPDALHKKADNKLRTAAAQPLLARHEIITLPSASTLAVLRREYAARRSAPRTVAVLADPVFSERDERVRGKASAPASKEAAPAHSAGNRLLLRALADIRAERSENESHTLVSALPTLDLRIARLSGTRWEAEQISSLVPARECLRALDFAASRATATSAELGQYRILHFATHALLNTVHPELSGIVLSLVDAQGRPQDGFLPAHEIYNLKLPAELVVLSACKTGLGKQVRGEGVVGLTQSFMYAGAPRVVVSLWALQDKAAADLMGRFYRRLLGVKPMMPAAALRAAQLEMWRAGQWPAPYFWAGFTLQGEWR